MMRRRVFLTNVAAAGTTALLGACSPTGTSGGDINLGLQTPLSPPGSVSGGQQAQRGAELGVEYVNGVMGGVLGGRKVALHVEDSKGQAETGVAGYRRLVTEKKVVAVFGYVHSSVLLAVNEVAKSLGVPTMGTYASARDVTAKGYDIAFRMHAIDPVRAGAWLRLIKERGYKRIGIVADDSDYGIGLVNETKAQAPELGLTLQLSDNVVDHNAVDLTPQLLKLKDFKPDFVVSACSTEKQQGLILEQASQIGLFPAVPMLFAADEPALSNFWQLHPKTGNQLMFITYFSPKQQFSDAGVWFAGKYREKYKEEPIYGSYNPFGAAIVIAQALNLAKSAEPKSLIQALESGSFKGWTSSPVTFPKKTGALWHNWSPPIRIVQYTQEGQDWKEARTVFEFAS